MVAATLFPTLLLLLVVMVNRAVATAERGPVLGAVILGYLARPTLFLLVMRSVAFFSHGVAGGDCNTYEQLGSLIARRWLFEPIHFLTNEELPQLGSAALPCNILALLEFIGGQPQPLAGTLLNAFIACWTVIIIYRFVRDAGVSARLSLRLLIVVLFGPAFLYHTSDTYKDGLNTFLVIASLVTSIRLSQRFEPQRLFYLFASLWALWYVRHYMVFMCLLPLFVGFLGTGRASTARRLAAGAAIVVLLVAAYVSGSVESAYGSAEQTFEYATSDTALGYNATVNLRGSGVIVDSFVPRLVYTVLAPFPWQGGSFGLQLGKIESLALYVYLFVLARHWRALWRAHRSSAMMLGLFVLPGTAAYAMTMSNVGLIVRQRMPIAVALGVLAVLALEAASRAPARAAPPSAVSLEGNA